MELKAKIHHEFTKHLSDIDLYNYPLAMIVYNKEQFILEKLKELKTGYIILPGYYYEDKPLEIQLAITGKKKVNETYTETVQREIAEETGFSIDNKFTPLQLQDKKRTIDFSIIKEDNIKDLEIKPNKSKDTKDKILTLIHLNEIKKETIFNRKRILSDDIAGKIIVIVSVENLITIYEKFINKEYKMCSKYCFKLTS